MNTRRSTKTFIRRRAMVRVRTRHYVVLSLAWSVVSFPAVDLIVSGSFSIWSLHGLLCGLLILPHLLMIALAVFYYLTEEPCCISDRIPDPNYPDEALVTPD